jgi:hypothetical protein
MNSDWLTINESDRDLLRMCYSGNSMDSLRKSARSLSQLIIQPGFESATYREANLRNL